MKYKWLYLMLALTWVCVGINLVFIFADPHAPLNVTYFGAALFCTWSAVRQWMSIWHIKEMDEEIERIEASITASLQQAVRTPFYTDPNTGRVWYGPRPPEQIVGPHGPGTTIKGAPRKIEAKFVQPEDDEA